MRSDSEDEPWYTGDPSARDLRRSLIFCAGVLVLTVVAGDLSLREAIGEAIFLAFVIVARYLQLTAGR